MENLPNPPPFTVHFRGNRPLPIRRRNHLIANRAMAHRSRTARNGTSNNPYLIPDSPELRINRGPPSTIPRNLARTLFTPPVRSVGERISALGSSFDAPAGSHARRRASGTAPRRSPPPLYARPAGRPIRLRHRNPNAGAGSRITREVPLMRADLWIDGVGPQGQPEPAADHQQCGICHGLKSHPVSYICGHSHCYICIRLWLEREWTCPDCTTVMNRPPFRQFAEEVALEAAFPEWRDESRVEYDWDGLVFPKFRYIPVTTDSE
ncbi:hypothetical protein B0H11DRAFT_2215788 [Mycena galericulata]|nr:hypothetical protein B0H11DRAFT_2215788 [Mycena galericulata]